MVRGKKAVLFQDYVSWVTLKKDLAALLRGTVKCKNGKLPVQKETGMEAFGRYIKTI